MPEAYIFDAIRTPRGKGKANGSLHEVTPVDLVANLMKEMEQRHHLDTSQIDDVILLKLYLGLWGLASGGWEAHL